MHAFIKNRDGCFNISRKVLSPLIVLIAAVYNSKTKKLNKKMPLSSASTALGLFNKEWIFASVFNFIESDSLSLNLFRNLISTKKIDLIGDSEL